VKILVPLKRVADPDHASKVKVVPGARQLDTSGLSTTANPFDDYALEAALRLTEDGRTPKERRGEVVVVTVGGCDSEPVLRAAPYESMQPMSS
jgi:electron transfer flavoprotein beta subunit